MQAKIKGYILGSIAAATYGLNPLFALPLYSDGMDTDSVLFFRYLFAIPIMGAMIKLRGRDFKVKRKEVLPLVTMGILMAFSSLFLFLSYTYMDAGIASTILFVYPVMVVVIMFLFFKERLSALTLICIAMAIAGIGLLYNGKPGATLSVIGVVFVMASALSYSLYMVGVNQSVLKDVPTIKTIFYVLTFGIVIFAARLIYLGDISLPTKWYMWGNVLALAVLPTVISFLCTTKSIQYIGSTPTAILGALEPLTAVVFGVTVFGEVLTFRDVCGLVLIVVAVSIVVAGGSVAAQLVRLRRLFPRIHKKKVTK